MKKKQKTLAELERELQEINKQIEQQEQKQNDFLSKRKGSLISSIVLASEVFGNTLDWLYKDRSKIYTQISKLKIQKNEQKEEASIDKRA